MEVAIRASDDARQMGVPEKSLNIDITAVGRRLASAPASRAYWEPRAYAEALSLSARTMARLAITRTRGRFFLSWEGRARVHPSKDFVDARREPVTVETGIGFAGVMVYEPSPARARSALEASFTSDGLVALPPEILARGRRKYWLFGERIGHKGWVRFNPQ